MTKKVGELLGEEPSFVDFIMQQLAQRQGAQAVLQVGRWLGRAGLGWAAGWLGVLVMLLPQPLTTEHARTLSPPAPPHQALGEVLDEDAESFTLKLWQILIYEQLKQQHVPQH